jgi:hypothetical protein
VRPPGELDELGEAGRAAWSDVVDKEVAKILKELVESESEPTGLAATGEADTGVHTIEWPAFPVRVAAELGAAAAMELLDQSSSGADEVGRGRQEEYLEWRLIRRDGEPRGIEMTTEFHEYWTVLAGHEPERALAQIGAFVGEELADPAKVYGPDLADDATPKKREEAFERTMLPGPKGELSPYNNGQAGLCCMVHSNNTLKALLALVLSAARPLLVKDAVTGETRYPSGSEAIAELGAEAEDGRNSDPLIVERIVRFVSEGRRVGFDDPLGVYIRELQLHELEQPNGEDVPREWLELSRGAGEAESADGRPRRQRLKLELPHDADFSLADLVVRRSGERLRFGGQLAELVELGAYARAGPSDPNEVDG